MNHDWVLGALASLGSAFFFALAAIYFARLGNEVPAAGINLGKGVIALALTGSVLLGRGAATISWSDGGLLAVSGLLGISLGDTAYFAALGRLGPRRTLVLDTLSPGVTLLLAVLLLAERPSLQQWTGMAITLVGVAWVMRERSGGGAREDGAWEWEGLLFGLVSMLCHAGGVILSKLGLHDVPALEASMLRQGVALLALCAVGLASGRLRGWIQPLGEWRRFRLLATAAFFGTFLGIYLSLLGLKLLSAAAANTLNSTSPLFILPLAILVSGERVSWRAALGAAVAVAGVIILAIPQG